MPVCNIYDCKTDSAAKRGGLCVKHRMQDYEKRNRPRINEYHREYRVKIRNQVFNHYGGKCACCGESELGFLSIDHINNDGSLDVMPSGKRRTGSLLYANIILNNYPETFQLLCMNCNWGKRKSRVCPHKSVVVQ